MSAATIVFIVIRLFAVYWAMAGLLGVAGAISMNAGIGYAADAGFAFWFSALAPSIVYAIIAGAVWFLAGVVSRHVVPRQGGTIESTDLCRGDLFGFGLLLIGASSFLSHLAPMLNWIHFLVMNRAGEELIHGQNGLSMYDVSREVIPCIGGAVLVVASRRIGVRLAGVGRGREVQAAACDGEIGGS
ncbi:MAG: hypothetical protein ACQCXQ_03745 [Verrucomicrobiales bacterium]|nr:hypothetical protein [Verrucomicrobiota bacterium JB025]